MKKLFAPFVLSILAVALLSSCSNSSKLSITKRHYRSGFYVHFGSKIQSPEIVKIPLKTRHLNTQVITAKSENQITSNASTITTVKSGIVEKNTPSKRNLISENKISSTTSAAKNIFNVTTYPANNVTENHGMENGQTLMESNSGGGDSAAGAALSLLWIVIVVILILWLIGILAGGWGLGGLINLLLVIALILLILWLLRIW